MGDPSGIGPAIIAKALPRVKGRVEFIVIGDKWVFKKIKNQKSKIKNYKFIDLHNINHKKFRFGKIRAEYGRASVDYIDRALELIRRKEINCLVTCPISKEAVSLSGMRKFSGHTEYLAKKTKAKYTVMFLLNRYLKFSLVTTHIPIGRVPAALSKRQKLSRNILITYAALKNLFAIKNPRIVVCGLNPHASDNGLIGDEENRIIKPVLKKLKKRILSLAGPISADVAIAKASQGRYDCVIVMYHDQALIPLKLLGAQTGVNLTLGLPFVRTSPLHGTAFDIASDFRRANPNSLIAAIELAIKCAANLKKD